ncbi:hypothetical protein [Halalkalicoccus tibetensis]|uniref:DUF8112 domain-containing protein n=1 Tax=Halalkalicoccus tibetensis TaxID=175632 RepID=A0ABD5V425_9EURY
MLITAPAEQFLAGYQLREERCSYCKTALQEGHSVSAYAVQYAGDDVWSIPRVYCRDCQSTITEPTLGATELLATGYLGCTMDVATQQSTLTLLGIEQIMKSPAEEGHATL